MYSGELTKPRSPEMGNANGMPGARSRFSLPSTRTGEASGDGSKQAEADGTQGAVVRVGALADLHCTKTLQGKLQPLLAAGGPGGRRAAAVRRSDGLRSAGRGDVLARELNAVHVPMIGVLGNHDFESGKQDEVATSWWRPA